MRGEQFVLERLQPVVRPPQAQVGFLSRRIEMAARLRNGGFAAALVADTLANASVLPLLALLPADLVSRCDGEYHAG